MHTRGKIEVVIEPGHEPTSTERDALVVARALNKLNARRK